ncbi:MAG: acetylornithine/N-succinyldiaminopimelate aminotransferase, partial [Myxococcota bacterium]
MITKPATQENPLTKHQLSPTPKPDAVMVNGKGSWLWDEDGNRYLDFVQGWAVNCLGHAPKLIQDALAVQAATLINPSPAYHNRV